MAEFKLSRFKYTWKGQWSSHSRYNPDDVVSFGGKVYTCLESHVSDANFYADLDFYNSDIPPLLVPKWELTADGVSWLGEWAVDTYYKVGDIVKLGGVTYVCTEAHTSKVPMEGNTADTAFELDAGKWTVQFSSTDWKINWATETYYKINDIVRYGGRIYRCNTSHESSAVLSEGLEANLAYWDIVSIADDWKGDWTTNTRYKINDLVKFGGNVYKCEIRHTSAITDELGLPADQGKWSLLHNGVEYKGTWQNNTYYKINDVVKYGGYLYIVNAFHDSSFVFSTEYYDIYCPGQEFDLIWNDTTVYQPGDVISYGGNLYTAITKHVNQIPSTSLSNWNLLYQGSLMHGDWDSAVEYHTGDVVRRGGNVYGCLVDNVGNDPDLTNDGSSTNSQYWDLIVTGVHWRGVWELGQTYIAGDTVVWVSSSYRCLDKHVADNGNRPDDDGADPVTLKGRYWEKLTDGNIINRLKNLGDIRTFGDTGDGSTIGYKALPIDEQGRALTVGSDFEVKWELLQNTENVFFVSETGVDIPTAGTSPQNPWRTIRYATENVPANSTIFVRTGDFPEILPIRIPAYVAVVGDEIRSTTVRPADGVFSSDYINLIIDSCNYIEALVSRVVREIVVGEVIEGEVDVPLYGTVPQNFDADAATSMQATSVGTLMQILKSRLESYTSVSVSSSYPASIVPGNIAAGAQIANNLEFIKNEITLYVQENNPGVVLPDSWNNDLNRIINALGYDIAYPGNYKTVEASTYFINGSNYDLNKQSDMFYLRDGTGLRNMTLTGLSGELGDRNINGTRRPSAGAFVSLDPGYGPSDVSAWVGTRSPYVQNVTTFGTGCIGCKIDGDIHSGGNQTIVANDFTQVLSDGIGVWANGTGRTELVSVFTYYNHIGYLATNGGKIRGTNGNCSYGTFGAVSEGFNTAETPITAVVNNRYYDATVHQALVANGGIQKLFFSNAGLEYSSASMSVNGSGINASLQADEFRDGAVFEIRIANPGDSSSEGGSGYLFATNAAQGGNAQRIQLAGSDENLASNYRGMRLLIGGGTGTGQYGYIADYDATGKYAYIGKESKVTANVFGTTSSGMIVNVSDTSHLKVNDPIVFSGTAFGNIENYTIYYVRTIVNSSQITISASSGPGAVFNLVNGTGSMTLHCAGWDHLVEGTDAVAVLDSTSSYYIEPRLTLSGPGFTTTSSTLPNLRQWASVAANDTVIVAVALDTNSVAYSADNGSSWNTSTLPTSALWTKVKYVGGVFMAFASNGAAAKSTNGISWTAMTMSSVAEWRDVAYGGGKWVAVAAGGIKSAYSTDAGATWNATTLPEGADWNAIEYGKNKFVTTALSDSSISGAATAYSTDGISWTLGNLAQGSYSLAYGNNRFVALSGGYAGATEVSVSFDGITWTEYTIQAQDWRGLIYAQGLFFAIATGTTVAATSRDGRNWDYQNMGVSAPWCGITYSSITKPGRFIAIGGLTANSTVARAIRTGVTAKARAYVVSGRMSELAIWEPGSGYTSPPVLTVTDPNNTSEVFTVIRTGSGVIANPTILNAGTGYETTSTRITITGNGYKDQYQIGSELMVTNMTRIPGPGDNVNISGINDYTYKLLTAEILGGTIGNYTARLQIAKDLGREESPEHGTSLSIRQLYSQVRITGHDFLDVGLGNFYETNYPDTLNPIGTVLAPEDEIKESNGGRVFYTATDQDGNFRVGELFAVEQATGTVTLNAQFFQLEGLEELRLGGVTVGGSGVVIREFSTDVTFTADSNNIIPTQRAIKAYMTARVSGGGADAITGQITAGVVQIGPESISTTTGDELIVRARMNFNGGVDGTLVALNYFTSSGS